MVNWYIFLPLIGLVVGYIAGQWSNGKDCEAQIREAKAQSVPPRRFTSAQQAAMQQALVGLGVESKMVGWWEWDQQVEMLVSRVLKELEAEAANPPAVNLTAELWYRIVNAKVFNGDDRSKVVSIVEAINAGNKYIITLGGNILNTGKPNELPVSIPGSHNSPPTINDPYWVLSSDECREVRKLLSVWHEGAQENLYLSADESAQLREVLRERRQAGGRIVLYLEVSEARFVCMVSKNWWPTGAYGGYEQQQEQFRTSLLGKLEAAGIK